MERKHRRQECPEITHMAMGFQPRSFPVGGMYVKDFGWLKKVEKITRFSSIASEPFRVRNGKIYRVRSMV